jgi:TfoX/Sxy family transcriptional regulator of competence genes
MEKQMASELDFVEYVRDQMHGAGAITFRKMFGEYAVYCNAKVVALVCDNQLFVKPTVAGRARIGTVSEAPPYPGAKPHFLIDEKLDDGPWLSGVIAATERELPMPLPKKPKAAKQAAVVKKASPAKKPAAAKKPAPAKKAAAQKTPVKKAAAKKTTLKKTASRRAKATSKRV